MPPASVPPDPVPAPTPGRLGELARVFLVMGATAFGGPAAHIAMLEREVVARRAWLSPQHFLDLVGATNLVPGPNSTEMVLHVGYERAGGRGLLVAGACFIGPAALVTLAVAWAYVRFGTLPEVAPFLVGVQPAVLAVVGAAAWRLGRKAVSGWRLGLLGAAVAAAVLAGADETLALVGGGLVGMVGLRAAGGPGSGSAGRLLPVLFQAAPSAGALAAGAGVAAAGVSLWKLGWFFLKVGSVLYGSGYVLVAFLEGGLVGGHGWLTQAELLDAVAVGQFTPGPVLSTATFVGYVVAGVSGAAVATAAIFLPSFAIVAVLNPLVPRVRRSAWLSAFLDAVNVASVALLAAVGVQLGADVLVSWPAWAIAAGAAAVSLRTDVNAGWLVAGGALAGWILAPWT